MPDTDPAEVEFRAQLAALRTQFAEQLGPTLDQLEARAQALGPEVSGAQLEELHDQLHRLAGSGGTFGFPELSRQARSLVVTAKRWLKRGEPVTPAAWRQWCDSLHALRQAVEPQAGAGDTSWVQRAGPAHTASHGQRVILVEDDAALGQELQRGLQQLGYGVTHYTDFASAQADILLSPPDVLVVDILLPGVNGTEAVGPLFAALGHRLPLIFITVDGDHPARIAAARAKGDAFMVKPVSAPRLADSIEDLLAERRQPPYRVLIVDDDELLAEHYRLTLTAAGMLVQCVSQADAVWAALEDLRPDLLLMNLRMPGCSGADLARAIRYDEAWQSLPIIYLSAESDVDSQGRALNSGADEFLLKPISDAQLVVGVRARAARARKVAELMSQDSLTGLLKHASIKDRLAQEMDRAKRQGTVMSAVMVDIDFFKRVNDSWGHPMGDQVIKTLGHLLRQRLRRQDSVGRYGGEEFVAVLPECSPDAALRLVEDIRTRFGAVKFNCQGQEFSVTLSAGIAGSEQFHTPADLLVAADVALYQAKQGGRNQVRLANVSASHESRQP
jgi:diguanylate cyclase (GGDEF)-like protein